MKFTLIYEGPLRASNKATKENKHAIRHTFDAQLQSLWAREPLLSHRSEAIGEAPVDLVSSYEAARDGNDPDTSPDTVQCVGNGYYLPIVNEKYNLLAEIGITWFRHKPPGSLHHIGDIDNRLKTILDCLQTPPPGQVVDRDEGNSPISPFYTVLEDDSLISSINVDTVRDLRPNAANSEVLLLIEVRTVVTAGVWGNTIFL